MQTMTQDSLFSPLADVDAVRELLGELHDDIAGKVARFRQLADLSVELGTYGSLLPGGEITYAAWLEARSSFVHGNFVATVMLCQGLAEQTLAARLEMMMGGERLPQRVAFQETLRRCAQVGLVPKLMLLRNPLSHYRNLDDETSLSARVLATRSPAAANLLGDAHFAISVAVRLLSLRAFRVDRH